jgi:hypothetical protein
VGEGDLTSWTVTVVPSSKLAKTYIDFARLLHG